MYVYRLYSEATQSLQRVEKDTSVELERARGVIAQLEDKVNLCEKERGKESKLRKEEQNRIMDLFEQKQKFETEGIHLKQQTENDQKCIEVMKNELSEVKTAIEEIKTQNEELLTQLQEQTKISEGKSETIQDYERRVEAYNEEINENATTIEELSEKVSLYKSQIYDMKNEILEKTNDIKYLKNKLNEVEITQQVFLGPPSNVLV